MEKSNEEIAQLLVNAYLLVEPTNACSAGKTDISMSNIVCIGANSFLKFLQSVCIPEKQLNHKTEEKKSSIRATKSVQTCFSSLEQQQKTNSLLPNENKHASIDKVTNPLQLVDKNSFDKTTFRVASSQATPTVRNVGIQVQQTSRRNLQQARVYAVQAQTVKVEPQCSIKMPLYKESITQPKTTAINKNIQTLWVPIGGNAFTCSNCKNGPKKCDKSKQSNPRKSTYNEITSYDKDCLRDALNSVDSRIRNLHVNRFIATRLDKSENDFLYISGHLNLLLHFLDEVKGPVKAVTQLVKRYLSHLLDLLVDFEDVGNLEAIRIDQKILEHARQYGLWNFRLARAKCLDKDTEDYERLCNLLKLCKAQSSGQNKEEETRPKRPRL